MSTRCQTVQKRLSSQPQQQAKPSQGPLVNLPVHQQRCASYVQKMPLQRLVTIIGHVTSNHPTDGDEQPPLPPAPQRTEQRVTNNVKHFEFLDMRCAKDRKKLRSWDRHQCRICCPITPMMLCSFKGFVTTPRCTCSSAHESATLSSPTAFLPRTCVCNDCICVA